MPLVIEPSPGQLASDSGLERYRGIIVQVGSALAYRGVPLQAAYCGPSVRAGKDVPMKIK